MGAQAVPGLLYLDHLSCHDERERVMVVCAYEAT
jgi:hypothetical protein